MSSFSKSIYMCVETFCLDISTQIGLLFLYFVDTDSALLQKEAPLAALVTDQHIQSATHGRKFLESRLGQLPGGVTAMPISKATKMRRKPSGNTQWMMQHLRSMYTRCIQISGAISWLGQIQEQHNSAAVCIGNHMRLQILVLVAVFTREIPKDEDNKNQTFWSPRVHLSAPRKSPEKPELPEQSLRQTVLTFKEAFLTSDLWWSFIFRGQSKLEGASSRYVVRPLSPRSRCDPLVASRLYGASDHCRGPGVFFLPRWHF